MALAGTGAFLWQAQRAAPAFPADGMIAQQADAPTMTAPASPEFSGDIDAEQGLALAADAWGDMERVADPVERKLVNLGRGETLMQLLLDAEVPQEHAQGAISALRGVYDPRRMRSGQEIKVLFDHSAGDGKFVGFEFQPAVERSVSVSFDGVRFQAAEVAKPLQRRWVAAQGRIESSLYQAGYASGVPTPVLNALINKLFNYDVDWQRDIQPGDSFEVLYEQYLTESGEVAKVGTVSYAALTLSGKRRELFLYEDSDGSADYFTRKGESVRKALLRTPVDGARLTSGFGMRMHPLLGYSKMHKGADFGAPTGTPVFAAGDGIVEEAGQKGAYGNYVRIRHNREIATAYAHLSRFGSGLRRGARVNQGDVIGYVGSTGRSTGPHLHYEVHRGGKQVNPMSVDLPTGRNLDGKELKRFQAVLAQIEDRYADAQAGLTLVSASAGRPAAKAEGCRKAPGC
ncbi:M23 family metallopeptidase [Aerophototrophica crusticola]|uniref:M23 family metallopeptidase n=2 Tax=Aerophototrophica crusticola TaxID=1709002 RepID=A0A858RB06_9PROT|nr:M23 family metallopeptidase [Rhodospirillaceae bacterium B3]